MDKFIGLSKLYNFDTSTLLEPEYPEIIIVPRKRYSPNTARDNYLPYHSQMFRNLVLYQCTYHTS